MQMPGEPRSIEGSLNDLSDKMDSEFSALVLWEYNSHPVKMH